LELAHLAELCFARRSAGGADLGAKRSHSLRRWLDDHDACDVRDDRRDCADRETESGAGAEPRRIEAARHAPVQERAGDDREAAGDRDDQRRFPPHDHPVHEAFAVRPELVRGWLDEHEEEPRGSDPEDAREDVHQAQDDQFEFHESLHCDPLWRG
jgi:hypothetical protein